MIKVHYIENFSEGDSTAQLEALKKVFKLVPLEEADLIYCASVAKVKEAIEAVKTSGKPLAVYCWDYYKWAHEGRNQGFNWALYQNLLDMASLILVPSDGQQKRLKELLNLKSVVCECGVTFYDQEISSGDYVLDPVRNYPEENLNWVKKACEELRIPYVHSEHKYTEQEFRMLVSNCAFMTCAYREASTGGLSLMEGLYNGKVALVSNSPYMGASNYIGEYGFYFQYDDFDDLKRMIKDLWEDRKSYDPKLTRKYCAYFTHDAFANRLKTEFKKIIK